MDWASNTCRGITNTLQCSRWSAMETSILIYTTLCQYERKGWVTQLNHWLFRTYTDMVSLSTTFVCITRLSHQGMQWEACNEFAGTEPRRSLALVTVCSNFQASKYFCQHCTGTYHTCVTKLCVRSSNTACLEGEGVQAPYNGVKFKCEWTSSLAESHVSCAPAGSC